MKTLHSKIFANLQDLISFINTTCVTSLVCSKSKVTKKIFNLEEWHPIAFEWSEDWLSYIGLTVLVF